MAPVNISIHASRGGSDQNVGLPLLDAIFQSTLPAGEATCIYAIPLESNIISIHASRGGSDLYICHTLRIKHNFNPRFPRGKRQVAHFNGVFCFVFQSTLPAGEATYLLIRKLLK